MVTLLRNPMMLAAALVLGINPVSVSQASSLEAPGAIVTCTSSVSGHVSILRDSSKSCLSGQSAEVWNLSLSGASSVDNAEFRKINICTPKSVAQNYTLVAPRCNRAQYSNTYIRQIAVPETPVIQSVSAIDQNSLRIVMMGLSARDALMKIKYRFINLKTGTEEKSAKEREGSYRITDLSANTSYEFIVYAENLDGISQASIASKAVSTLSKPIRIVTQVSQNNNSSEPRTYQLGDTGPGGGKIFYVDLVGFNCGVGHTSTGSPTGALCNYLEVAPSTWNAGRIDPLLPWAISTGGIDQLAVPNMSLNDVDFTDPSRIGSGYFNSEAIVAQGNNLGTAAGISRSYQGGGLSDWYLGHIVEMSLLCQWAFGQNPSVSQTCSGSTLVNDSFEQDSDYASSSQSGNSAAIYQNFRLGIQDIDGTSKSTLYRIRPIRAF